MLNIDLSIENSALHVFAKFIINDTSNNICFTLNQTLEIIKVIDESENNYTPLCEELNLRFHPKLNKYTIKPECTAKEILIEYRGTVSTRSHNVITDDCIALNWYSTWYPQKPIDIISNEFSDTCVTIKNMEGYKLIKGTKSGNTWRYVPLDYDINIIALKNYKEIKYDSLSFSYLKKYENAISEKYVKYLDNIIEYYRDIFEFGTLPQMDIVVLPNTNPYDGYIRERLIVLGGFCEDTTYAIKLIAHEIAHIWCTGADVLSWEDWLNETFAEWSALLFVSEYLGANEFEKIIKSHRVDNLPPIKTLDGTRPERGVHDNGTIMLYELYLLYGKDVIIKLLKTFHQLEKKTTKDFLYSLRANNLSNVASYVESIVYK
jgi:hypothetical protein